MSNTPAGQETGTGDHESNVLAGLFPLAELISPAPVENPLNTERYHHESLEESIESHFPSRRFHDSVPRIRGLLRPLSNHIPDLERAYSQRGRWTYNDTEADVWDTFPTGSGRGRGSEQRHDMYEFPDAYGNLNELAAPLPEENPEEARIYRHHSLEERPRRLSTASRSRSRSDQRRQEWGGHSSRAKSSKRVRKGITTAVRHASKIFTELYTVSYLIFFSILGALARLGLDALTTYTGAPVTAVSVWANFAGTFFLGFLVESFQLGSLKTVAEKPRNRSVNVSEVPSESNSVMELDNDPEILDDGEPTMPEPTPIFIGLTAGFCGSLTSFSSFMRDCFLALSNELTAPRYYNGEIPSSIAPRAPGLDVMAFLAVVIITVSLCVSGLKMGAHCSILLGSSNLELPNALRFFLDRCAVVVGFGSWIAAIIMTVFPPDRPGGPMGKDSWELESWRGQALFAIVLAPVGCLLRLFISMKLNAVFAAFPLGTFIVNSFGTAVLGIAWDLQHAPLQGGAIGGGMVPCQLLQGVMDGFSGCLTTVSTWAMELSSLHRKHSTVYGIVSIGTSLALLLATMGIMKWTVGWRQAVCIVP